MYNVMDSDQEILEDGSDLSDPFLAIPPPLSQTLQSDPIPDPKPLSSKTIVSPIPEPSQSPAAKKRKVSTQDIQKMQFEVLKKTKIELEVEILKLANEKLLLENHLLNSQGVFNKVEQ